MKTLRGLLPLFLLLAGTALIVQLSLRRETRSTVDAVAVPRTPIYTAERTSWTRFNAEGQPELRATAQRIDYYDDRAMQLAEVQLDRLGGAQGRWQLNAAQGEVPAGESRMRLSPAVDARGTVQDGTPLQVAAREVWVDWRRREIRSDAPVTATAPGRVLRADAWQTDFSATNTRLQGKVEVHYDVPAR